jgi:Spy/CpxP family protein refolding chaperone
MRKHVLVALSTAVVLVFGCMAFALAAQSVGKTAKPGITGSSSQLDKPMGVRMCGFFHKNPLKALEEKLGITDQQKKQFRSLYVSFRENTRKDRLTLIGLKDEVKTMLLSGKIDQQKLAQIDDQLLKVKTNLLKDKLKFKSDRLALLTPDQQGKLADLIAAKMFAAKFKKMHRWHEMHGGMMHGGMMHGGGGMDE